MEWAKILIENSVLGGVLVWALIQHTKNTDRLFRALEDTAKSLHDLKLAVEKRFEEV